MSNRSNSQLDLWRAADQALDGLSAGAGVQPGQRLVHDQDPDPERAAIMEFEGSLPRALAERFARDLREIGPNPSTEAVAALDARIIAIESGASPSMRGGTYERAQSTSLRNSVAGERK